MLHVIIRLINEVINFAACFAYPFDWCIMRWPWWASMVLESAWIAPFRSMYAISQPIVFFKLFFFTKKV